MPIIPGKTYLVTRRCTQRQFLLTPSPFINETLIYLIGLAASRKGVLIHAVCIMGNHLHLVLTDTQGELCEFCRWLFEFIAKCVNASRGRWESLFASGTSYSRVELLDDDSVLDKIVYTLANPVLAGLVPGGKQWPGIRLGPWQLGKGHTAKRPSFFRVDGAMPAKASLGICKPPNFEHMDDKSYVEMIDKAVAKREEKVRRERSTQGKGFLGVKAIVEQSPTATPWSTEEGRQLNPRVASPDKWRRIQAHQRDKAWQEHYREALDRYRAGNTNVEFPAGTYWMVRYAGAKCAVYEHD